MVAWMAGILDFCLIAAAAAASLALYPALLGAATGPEDYVLLVALAAILFVGAVERCGGYRVERLSNLPWQAVNLPKIWGGVALLLLVLAYGLNRVSAGYSPGWVLAWIAAAFGLLPAGRGILHLALARRLRAGHFARNVVIVGAGDEGQRLIAKLRRQQDASIVVRGVFDDRKSGIPASVEGLRVLGTTDELLRFVRRYPIDQAIVALPLEEERQLNAVFDRLQEVAIDLRLSVEPLAEKFQIRGLGTIAGVPVFEIANRPLKPWQAAVKRTEDIVLAALLLILFGPLMGLAALLIKLDSPGPVFFVQRRFGFNNNPISVLKFRTMFNDRSDPSGERRTVQNDPRITRIGRILRWLSIDELPQLINILRGEMSLVGPRAHAIAMKAGDRLYCEAVERYLHRHRVRPGITGWAQVNGLRGEVDTLRKAHARVAHDLYYIEHWSLWLDFKILLKTVCVVATRDNAY
ncbi:MAG TPA: undecaprenyl-phosphate glucose phosphotransferase [Stellaceae bacterium]|nr:undecaprenyl-phosphate glucose phosphotransferase [Stellaceae bacterium]